MPPCHLRFYHPKIELILLLTDYHHFPINNTVELHTVQVQYVPVLVPYLYGTSTGDRKVFVLYVYTGIYGTGILLVYTGTCTVQVLLYTCTSTVQWSRSSSSSSIVHYCASAFWVSCNPYQSTSIYRYIRRTAALQPFYQIHMCFSYFMNWSNGVSAS